MLPNLCVHIFVLISLFAAAWEQPYIMDIMNIFIYQTTGSMNNLTNKINKRKYGKMM